MYDPLRDAIEAELVVETGHWAHERVTRVAEQLQRDTHPEARVGAAVIASERHTIFLAANTIYVSRHLIERLPTEEALAIVMAIEVAHHRLGHVPRIPPAMYWPFKLAFALQALRYAMTAQHRERDADIVAVEIVHDAGFDIELALAAFEVLGTALEDNEREAEARIADRVLRMRAHRELLRMGERFPVQRAADRERTLQRRLAWGAGGVAALATAVLLRRR